MDFRHSNHPGVVKSMPIMHTSNHTRHRNIGVYMQVIIGKTVESYKVNSGIYISQGKVGAAILGNEDQSRYDLYIYRENQQKITSARIASRFQFEVHENLYCSFYDNAGVAWSIRFDQESDSTEFIREVTLARWKSGRGTVRVLVQELRHGDSSCLIKPDSVISVRYTAAVLNADNKFAPESDGQITRDVERLASSQQWETVMTNCRLNSSRIVILPAGHQLQGRWMDLLDIENGDHLWLQMDIQKISSPGSSVPRLEGKESVSSRMGEEKLVSKKDEITTRLLKMGGQALVPFPSFPSDSVESLDQQHNQEEVDVGLTSKSLDYIKKCSSSPPPILPSVVGNHQSAPSIAETSYSTVHHLPPIQSEFHDRGMMARKESELNMLISEVRTTNSHLCMSVMRMTDKMDNFLTKNEGGRGDVSSGLSHWLSNNNNLKSDLESRLNVISQQNQAIMDALLVQEKAKMDLMGRIESMQDDMMNTILSIVPKQDIERPVEQKALPAIVCSEETCQFAGQASTLTYQLRELERINSRLENDLSASRGKVDELTKELATNLKQFSDHFKETELQILDKEKVIDVLRQKVEELYAARKDNEPQTVEPSEEPQVERLATVKLAAAERTVEVLRKRVRELEELCDQHYQKEGHLGAAIKMAMNMAWRSLREILPDEELQNKVAPALRVVTRHVIDQYYYKKFTPTAGTSSESGRFSPSASLPVIISQDVQKNSEPVNEFNELANLKTIEKTIEELKSLQISEDDQPSSAKSSSSHIKCPSISPSLPEDEQPLLEKSSRQVEELSGSSQSIKPVKEDNSFQILETTSVKEQEEKYVSECSAKPDDRPQVLPSAALKEFAPKSEVVKSPGDGLVDRKPAAIVSPGDGLPEKPPVPAKRQEIVHPLRESLSESSTSSHILIRELENPSVMNIPRKSSSTCSCATGIYANLKFSWDTDNEQNQSQNNSQNQTRLPGQSSDSFESNFEGDSKSKFENSFWKSSSDSSGLNQSVSSSEVMEPKGAGLLEVKSVSAVTSREDTLEDKEIGDRDNQVLADPYDQRISEELTAVHTSSSDRSLEQSDSPPENDGKSRLAEESADDRTYTVQDWSDDETEATNDSSFEPPYAPLVSSEPPPLSSSSSPSSPSPPPMRHLSRVKSDSTSSKSDKEQSNEVWTVKPPPLNLDEEEDEDAWLF